MKARTLLGLLALAALTACDGGDRICVPVSCEAHDLPRITVRVADMSPLPNRCVLSAGYLLDDGSEVVFPCACDLEKASLRQAWFFEPMRCAVFPPAGEATTVFLEGDGFPRQERLVTAPCACGSATTVTF